MQVNSLSARRRCTKWMQDAPGEVPFCSGLSTRLREFAMHQALGALIPSPLPCFAKLIDTHSVLQQHGTLFAKIGRALQVAMGLESCRHDESVPRKNSPAFRGRLSHW